ncbi:inosine-uridine nucleoside N-ribohydrolase [Erwinia toletana]|uniref:Inosine-uridine nucleoside N-ribohydrolase n=1 Tax=Winslowiella toletana TaxID=92490 RepID=A0ABS4P3F9_9GAMM|nr:nucleoside hydrolase [Winslowiella toletana]MBP2167194.1 inosine-uridine nucleoside N-ribohydrolase [Winslowiella toletana]
MTADFRRKIILDTDPAIGIPGTDADDPIAIMLAVKDPRLELLGVTTIFGNCPPDLGARCATQVLASAGRSDIPVAIGMATRMGGDLPELLQQAYAGARGQPGSIPLPALEDAHNHQHAVDFIIETVLAHPGEVTIVAIGAQTNIALAMVKEPKICAALHSIVFMGGALGFNAEHGRGNITPVAECNIWFDSQAADIVFRSGVDLTMVGLDVTNPATGLVLAKEPVANINAAASPLAAMFKQVCATFLDAPMFEWSEGCVLYDPLAVAVAADPALGQFTPMAIAVETQGRLTLGQTVPLRDQPANMRVCTGVDGQAAVRDIVATILA